jgi:hypothetical protein
VTPLNRLASLLAASAAIVLPTSQLQAAPIYWQNNTTGDITSSNYSTDNTTLNLAPTAADEVNVGAEGTATRSTAGTTNF